MDNSAAQSRGSRVAPTWRIFRKWGQASAFLGIVRAPDPQAAFAEAIRAFNITNPDHQKRLVAELRE
jgi:hypothetical protein